MRTLCLNDDDFAQLRLLADAPRRTWGDPRHALTAYIVPPARMAVLRRVLDAATVNPSEDVQASPGAPESLAGTSHGASCGVCGGIGWRISERYEGLWAVERCDTCETLPTDAMAARLAHHFAGIVVRRQYPYVLLDQSPEGVAHAIAAMKTTAKQV